jgi:hypothetical protein
MRKEPASNAALITLGDVLRDVRGHRESAWLYLPGEASWTLDSRAAVLVSEEVPPESEDDSMAGVPEAARRAGLVRALPISAVGEIVANARAQRADADLAVLLTAFLHYYDTDSFVELS